MGFVSFWCPSEMMKHVDKFFPNGLMEFRRIDGENHGVLLDFTFNVIMFMGQKVRTAISISILSEEIFLDF